MIGTITPLVQEANGLIRWIQALLAYSVGSRLASAFVGGLLGLGELLVGGLWDQGADVLVGGALIAAATELGVIRRPQPIIRRSTKKMWRVRFGPTASAFLWGADLGLGVTTRVSFVSYWLIVAAAFVAAEPLQGAILLVGYGIGRAVLVASGPLLLIGRPTDDHGDGLFEDVATWHRLHGMWSLTMAVFLAVLLP